MLEYHPEPWNEWVNVGNLEIARAYLALLSVGPQHIPCLSGKSYDNTPHTDADTKLRPSELTYVCDILVCMIFGHYQTNKGAVQRALLLLRK